MRLEYGIRVSTATHDQNAFTFPNTMNGTYTPAKVKTMLKKDQAKTTSKSLNQSPTQLLEPKKYW